MVSVLAAVPRRGLPFPPTGPCGSVPRPHRYYGSLRLLDVRPAALRFLRLAVPRMHPVASAGLEDAPVPAGLAMPRPPTPRLRGDVEISQVPGESCADALRSLIPARSATPGPYSVVDVAFRESHHVGPHYYLVFEAQSRSSSARCLRFAARVAPAPRKTRFRLADRLGRTGLATRGIAKKVSVHTSTSTKLGLAHEMSVRNSVPETGGCGGPQGWLSR